MKIFVKEGEITLPMHFFICKHLLIEKYFTRSPIPQCTVCYCEKGCSRPEAEPHKKSGGLTPNKLFGTVDPEVYERKSLCNTKQRPTPKSVSALCFEIHLSERKT